MTYLCMQAQARTRIDLSPQLKVVGMSLIINQGMNARSETATIYIYIYIHTTHNSQLRQLNYFVKSSDLGLHYTFFLFSHTIYPGPLHTFAHGAVNPIVDSFLIIDELIRTSMFQ